MKIIEREKYLNKLKNVIGTPDIKVITGVRRSGKSKLLDKFKEYITENVNNCNIIHINFNIREFECLKEADLLYKFVSDNYKVNMQNILLIDEVQMCENFEKAVNWLHAEEKYDIYITGSNAFLLSSDLAILFTGRTYEIEIYPFSFKEFCSYYNYNDLDFSFDKYVLESGMAGSYLYKNNDDKYLYIKEFYNALIIRDIKQKYKIRNIKLLNELSVFLMDNISNIVSSRSIARVINKNSSNAVSDNTINSYIKFLCNAFAFYKIRRYDIQGKKYLSSQDKYYLVDSSFRYAMIGTKNKNYGRVYENFVAI